MNSMQESAPAPRKRRTAAAVLGLGAATLLAADNAEAATEVAQLAAGDNRVAVLGTLLIPVLGWVAFNIAQPALNQLARMQEKNSEVRHSGGLVQWASGMR